MTDKGESIAVHKGVHRLGKGEAAVFEGGFFKGLRRGIAFLGTLKGTQEPRPLAKKGMGASEADLASTKSQLPPGDSTDPRGFIQIRLVHPGGEVGLKENHV